MKAVLWSPLPWQSLERLAPLEGQSLNPGGPISQDIARRGGSMKLWAQIPDVSTLIGVKGANIRELAERTGCHIRTRLETSIIHPTPGPRGPKMSFINIIYI